MHRNMDKNSLLIDLAEKGRFWNVAFEDLSSSEQVFLAIWDLESEVNNGGFEQYYCNSSGDTAFAVLSALEQIGAQAVAKIVSRANSAFPSELPPRNRCERQQLIEEFDSRVQDMLDSLDEEFFGYPDNLTDLLFEFVKLNSSEIEGAVNVGI